MISLTEHHRRVRELPCAVSRAREGITLHHCHGGSLAPFLQLAGMSPGMSQRANDWLVIPLALKYHSLDGHGIDANVGVKTWEERYGSQVEHLVWVSRELGYNVFSKAGLGVRIKGM